MADGQATLLGHSKKVMVETNTGAQPLVSARDVREQAALAAFALPQLVYRIYSAFLTQVVVGSVRLIDKHRRVLAAQFLAALDESRRREAARVINRYRHLIDGDEYRG
jgi:hypothetical protein